MKDATILNQTTKKDLIGKYTVIVYSNGKTFIERYFKEIGLSVRVEVKK